MLMNHEHETFLRAWDESLGDATFVRATLGKPSGATDIKKMTFSAVTVRDKPSLRVVYSFATKDITKNLTYANAIEDAGAHIGKVFSSATLFTAKHDLTLAYNKRGEPRLIKSKPSLTAPASSEHNRAKTYAVDSSRPYLHHLGITLDDGRVKPSMYPKFRQICHFIEIIADLMRASPLHTQAALSVIDISSGKGYLTFALYDYLTAHLKKSASVTGVEVRADLVQFCTDVASRAGLKGLAFEAVHAGQMRVAPTDLLIALHACDTATDDAIAHGIAANAAIIVVAPCCQHELAPQLSDVSEALRGLTKFGLLKQRQADLVTDAARCLLMEAQGYKVKVIEFVSTEHTAKNILIAGIRAGDVDRAAALRQYEALKIFMKFETHHLEQRLAERKRSTT